MDSELLMKMVLAHPEVEISGDNGTKQLLGVIPRLLHNELSAQLSLGALMRAQYALIVKLTEHAEEEDKQWYEPTLAALARWDQPERFLEATKRTVAGYLDWSYVPAVHSLRSGDACKETVLELFLAHPYTIIAPLLRSVRNPRH